MWHIVSRKFFQHLIGHFLDRLLPGLAFPAAAVFGLDVEDGTQGFISHVGLISDVSIGVEAKYLLELESSSSSLFVICST